MRKIYKAEIRPRLVMTSDPILGVAYSLRNVMVREYIDLSLLGGESMVYPSNLTIKLGRKSINIKQD